MPGDEYWQAFARYLPLKGFLETQPQPPLSQLFLPRPRDAR
jgi:hypothetical protein